MHGHILSLALETFTPYGDHVYSALIATLPGHRYLDDALASVFQQTVPPAAVHVISDDGIADGESWVRSVRSAYPDIHVHLHPGVGLASALAWGIGLVTTDFVAFLDCDDRWRPHKQERQLACLREDTDVDAATAQAVRVRLIDGTWQAESSSVPCSTFTNTTFRTTTFERFGLPDPRAGHFAWLYRWWSTARSNGLRSTLVDYVGLERRLHEDNSWIVNNDRARRDLLHELRLLEARHRRREDD